MNSTDNHSQGSFTENKWLYEHLKQGLVRVHFFYFGKKMVKNLAEDLHIRPVLECRNPVQLCLVIVCPTKREGKQRPKFLVHIPL